MIIRDRTFELIIYLQAKIKFIHVSDSLVIIPTFKEKENIEKIIRKVFSLEKAFHILIVEDNSPDGTADIVKRLMKEFPDKLFIEERKGKLGLGTAYIHGFKWALKRNYEYIYEMDADFSHNPEDLIRLHNACANEGGDMAIGSRYIKGVNVVNWPMGRVLMSYYASAYVRIITGMSIRDTTAGFKCYKRKVLEAIELDKIKFTGYALSQKLKVLKNLQTAYFQISAADLKKYNSKTGDTEGLVNYALSLKGVVFSAVIIERPDTIRLSLRSKGGFSVNDFAKDHFSGGGHPNAAGGISDLGLEETVDKFEKLVKTYEKELIKNNKETK